MTNEPQKPSEPDRSKYIGGSDIGVIMGMSENMTPYELWLEKTHKVPKRPPSLATGAGHALENLILDKYCETKGRTIIRQVQLHSDEYPWAGGTADGIDYEAGVIVDAKASCAFGTWQYGPPQHVYSQMQWYMWLSGGIRQADIALLQANAGWSFTTFEIQRNDDFIREAIEAASDFWTCIIEDTAPEPLCYEDVMRMFPIPKKKEIIATRLVEEMVLAWEKMATQSRKIDDEIAEIRNDLALYMLDHDVLTSESGRALVRSVNGKWGRQLRIVG